MQISALSSSCTKLKSKWIKDLHIKADTLNIIEKKVGKSLEHIGTGENFLNRTPMAYVLQSRIDKWNLIKLQSFIKAKDTLNRRKWQAIDWWKIFNNSTSDRRIISNIYKELKKLDSMEPNNPIKKIGNRAREFYTEEYRLVMPVDRQTDLEIDK